MVEYLDPEVGNYRRLWLRNENLVRAVLYDVTRQGNDYFESLLVKGY